MCSESSIRRPSISMEISMARIEEDRDISDRNNDNPFCSSPAGIIFMALAAGGGYFATDSMIQAYKNTDIKLMLVYGLFDIFALALAGGGASIVLNNCKESYSEK